MDKGAHFYRCDFQVHTPRDLNWSGAGATTPEERKIYADSLILACRSKGIDAITITDHHDLAFFNYVKKAAVDEVDDEGQSVPANKRIIVFPGIELTLTSPACQAILILDAEFPENNLLSVLTALSISPSPSEQSKHANIERIPTAVVGSLVGLYEKLNSHQQIKNRFIVLPNVSESGHGTMLRSGFGDFYKTMPCVGGYVDGSISRFGAGNLSIINGRNREYGFKSIAVFQTSDNRKRDHSDLGTHTTWVKWSEPTAEALRQACLAKESRMAHVEPQLPTVWISSINVSNSKFLSRVNLELNQQYNAIIGSRGTGKSTILEYLRWALCDQPIEGYDSDIAPVQLKRKKLIEDTLQRYDGEIYVSFILNGIQHIIKRNSNSQEIFLKIGEAEFVVVAEQQIRNLLPIQAYSQKQLSSVGIRVEELKRFVELPIKQIIDEIKSTIRDTAAQIRIAYSNLIRKREIGVDLEKYGTETDSLTQQLRTLRDGLVGLSTGDLEIINQKQKYDNEAIIIDALAAELTRRRDSIQDLKSTFTNESTQAGGDIQNEELLRQIETEYTNKFSEVDRRIDEALLLLSAEFTQSVSEKINSWSSIKADFDRQYEQAKANSTANQQQIDQIRDKELRIASLRRHQQEKANALSQLGDPNQAYEELKSSWVTLHRNKITVVTEQAQKLSQLSEGLIKVEVLKSLDTSLMKQKLKTAFGGLNIREQKIDDICAHVVNAEDLLNAWSRILDELEALAVHAVGGTTPLPTTAVLDSCNFIDSEKLRLATNLTSEKWIELAVCELEFNPIFKYCTNKETNEFIAFENASAGQQATALLTVLLNQTGPPLIIDQPEEDIDSKLINEIIEKIWKAKKSRQLIFASHNANFVVNGDAELVVCCDYARAGDQTGGSIKCAGAIDNIQVREEITVVTEGGKVAFELRMKKYGF